MQVLGGLLSDNPQQCLIVENQLDVAILLTVCFCRIDKASEAGVQATN